ncbi:MAG: OmpH family outer membrane protein [Flavobacteriales bacterium]|jgi:outer membrane protein
MNKILLSLIIPVVLATGVSAQKFGYVDSKYILSHMPSYQAAQQEINKLSDQWQKEIEEKYTTIDKLEKAYQAEKILLTDEMRKKREEEIAQKRVEAKDMQKKKFGVDGELFQKREELIKPIQDEIYQAIQEVSSQSALMVVFDRANHSNILYSNPKHDISDKVLKKMGLKPGEILEEEDTEGEDGEDGGTEAPKSGGNTTEPRGGRTGGERPPAKK